MGADINFDDLTDHFQKRIYGSRKGRIRLAVLERDLEENIPNIEKGGLSVLDLGAGLGHMGLKLAGYGHAVCINDISENMLKVARLEAQKLGVEQEVCWHHGAFQDLQDKAYDLVLCHAVLEWLNNPESLIEKLTQLAKQGGLVSLMFYNKDALVFHNLVRGNFKKINNNDFSGMKGGLTPPNPVALAWVRHMLDRYGFSVCYQSGVRVFSDYAGVRRGGHAHDDDVVAMELRYSQREPFWRLGRYIHLICKASD